MQSSEVLAVDIGGTKMAVARVDRAGTITWRASAPTPPAASASADQVWSVVAGLVEQAVQSGPVEACGAGCGGPMEGGDSVSPLHIPAWRRFPLRSRLAALTSVPTAVDNDARALALGEGWKGGAVGAADYLAMVVSTGVGGGIVLDGRLVSGRTGNAGHIGHVTVVPGGRRCRCGARGCLEAEASGTALAAISGRPAAEAGPGLVERTGRLVGRAVGTVANLLDLDVASVAGSVALGFGAPFFRAARDELAATARLPYSSRCRIGPSPLGPDAPLVGAAALAWKQAA